MTRLSVNVNKIATLRNARGGNLPDVVQFALDCERFGADGITVHPRPDERHITRADTLQLSKSIKTELNIEGYPDKRFMEIVSECRPTQATLVPDPPNVLTSNTGWDLEKNGEMLSPIIAELKKMGIRVALFMGTELMQIELAALLGADRIELYTGPYAENYDLDPATAISAYVKAVEFAQSKGLGINAGHDLSLQNLSHFKTCIPNLLEVSIGHALISEALYLGIDTTIQRYQACLKKADF